MPPLDWCVQPVCHHCTYKRRHDDRWRVHDVPFTTSVWYYDRYCQTQTKLPYMYALYICCNASLDASLQSWCRRPLSSQARPPLTEASEPGQIKRLPARHPAPSVKSQITQSQTTIIANASEQRQSVRRSGRRCCDDPAAVAVRRAGQQEQVQQQQVRDCANTRPRLRPQVQACRQY